MARAADVRDLLEKIRMIGTLFTDQEVAEIKRVIYYTVCRLEQEAKEANQ